MGFRTLSDGPLGLQRGSSLRLKEKHPKWVAEKNSKKKSYVLRMDPFDEVYKGDCLTFRGQNDSFPRYDNFFANFCQKVPHFEGL